MIEFEAIEEKKQYASPHVCIKVLGVGGAGGNTINSMIDAGCQNIEFIAANTDAQALGMSKAHHTVQLGVKSTKGLGTGANPEIGKRAAEEDLEKVMSLVDNADIVFITGGLGGGTGSGGMPVIARELKDKGILTIAVVTKPFLFEGKRRIDVADSSLKLLQPDVDTLIILPNQNLLNHVDVSVSMIDAFSVINSILYQSVKGISDIITQPGHINVDFADVKAILKDMGVALIGTGKAQGSDRAQEAAQQAISSPLLENIDIAGAQGVLLNITGPTNLTLHEISEIASVIHKKSDLESNIIIDSVIDATLEDDIHVSLLATGFNQDHKENLVEKNMQTEQNNQAPITSPKKEHQEPTKHTSLIKSESFITQTQQEYSDELDIPSFLRQRAKKELSE